MRAKSFTHHIFTTRTCDLSLVRSHLNRFYLKTLCTHQFARNRIYLVTRCNAKRKVWRINEWNKKKCRVKDERQMEMWHRHTSRTTSHLLYSITTKCFGYESTLCAIKAHKNRKKKNTNSMRKNDLVLHTSQHKILFSPITHRIQTFKRVQTARKTLKLNSM